jgi:hypothetical protein
VRGTRICTVAVIAVSGGGAVVGIAAAASPPPPSRVQITRAVHNATHSRYLWATVNVCERHRRGGLVGVRGQMPALGFAATLSMTVQLRQYDTAAKRFEFVHGATARHTSTLGGVRTGVHQSGAEFPYATDAGELDAFVTFTWTRDGRRLAQVTLPTSGGHPTAAYATPRGYSAASCRL